MCIHNGKALNALFLHLCIGTADSVPVSTIYNSKITSLALEDFNSQGYVINCARVDFLDESINEMNSVISQVKAGKRLEGKCYTNGNLNRTI